MKRRILSLTLVVLMLLALFAGCGNTESAETAETAAPTASQATDTTEAEATAEPAPEETSLYPLVDEPTVLTYWAPFACEFTDAVSQYSDIPTFDAVEEYTGVTIEWESVSNSDVNSLFNIMVSTGDYCDMISSAVTYLSSVEYGISEGIIIDVADLIHDYAPNYAAIVDNDSAVPEKVYNANGQMGAIYAFQERAEYPIGLMIRQDWLDELGLDTPVTYEDFYDVLTAFKTEYDCEATYLFGASAQNGNAFASGFGVSGYNTLLIGSCHPHMYQVDGVVHDSLIEDGYKDYLKLMNQYWEDGLLYKDFLSIGMLNVDENATSLITNDQVGLTYARVNNMVMYQTNSVNSNFRMVGIAEPVQTEGEVTHFRTQDKVYSNGTSISGDCENVELALRWLDFWYSDEGIMYYNWGIEGESYEVESDGTVVLTDLVTDNEWGVEASQAIYYWSLINAYAGSVILADRNYYFMNSDQQAALNTWADHDDGAYFLSKMELSGTDADTYNNTITDLETYATENALKFITGELDIDANWDNYVAQLKAIGIEECIACYQRAYDSLYHG